MINRRFILLLAAFLFCLFIVDSSLADDEFYVIPVAKVDIPMGLIILFSGPIDSNGNPVIDGEPDLDWQICDGTNETPDLRDRFILGSGSEYNTGDIGGSDTVILTEAQLPSHTHTVSGNTQTAKFTHRHNYGDDLSELHLATYWSLGWFQVSVVGSLDTLTTPEEVLESDQTETVGDETNHAHTIKSDTGYTGDSQPMENKPPFYALSFIMYVGH